MTDTLWQDVDIRVIDQRIGWGVGGMDTVIRVYHKPSGIIVEVPRVTNSQFNDRAVALDMIQSAITNPLFRGEP
jgi:protein subunit release factor A